MKGFDPSYIYKSDPEKGILVAIQDANIQEFDERLLKLGDLRTPSKPLDALSVFFDLEGFTDFARQVDPQLTVPSFISEFIAWIFSTIRTEFTQSSKKKTLWAELPVFSKFMGDGVLFLWKLDLDKIIGIEPKRPTDKIQYEIQEFICNIIASLLDVCVKYRDFNEEVCTRFVSPPPRVRCGIARGTVIPIGHNADFVGPCINIAARLQKFYGLSFAFSARGIDSVGFSESYRKKFLKKRSAIRGIGEKELIYVLKDEFKNLDAEDKKHLSNP